MDVGLGTEVDVEGKGFVGRGYIPGCQSVSQLDLLCL